ncbi:MAG: YraN family protein [Acidobacteriota bacterium]
MQTLPQLRHARLSFFEKTLGWLDQAASRSTRSPKHPAHLMTGLRGEDATYFHLRELGYTIVARRWSSPKFRGDVDLIGWDGEWLCFIEVKTRSTRTFHPAEVAVDHEKRTHLARLAKEYVHQLEHSEMIPVRFDVVSVYLPVGKPEFELFRGAFSWNDVALSDFRTSK